jgi:hypothetical protein
VTLLATPLLVIAAAASGQQIQIAPGWYVLGDYPGEYSIGVEPVRRTGGEGWAGATIRSMTMGPGGEGILAQSIRADAYRGQRVRLTGWIRTASTELAGQAGLWMRVDGPRGVLAADFMTDRPLVGTRDWAPYSAVLDVPRDAVGITFGLALAGAGQVWLDDVDLAVVGREVATTGRSGSDIARSMIARPPLAAYRSAPMRPVNLSFEQMRVVARGTSDTAGTPRSWR